MLYFHNKYHHKTITNAYGFHQSSPKPLFAFNSRAADNK
jgi:hypothetical protein